MLRLQAKTVSEQGAHIHHVLVYFVFSFFPQQKPAFWLFVFSVSKTWMVKESNFPFMYLSLGLLLFKCRIAGNNLANEMRVYKEIPWKSNNQAIFVTLCPLSMPVANAIPSL